MKRAPPQQRFFLWSCTSWLLVVLIPALLLGSAFWTSDSFILCSALSFQNKIQNQRKITRLSSRDTTSRRREHFVARSSTRTTMTFSASATPESSSFSDTETSDFGIVGDWEEFDGNLILRPPTSTQPRALIHFLGGAIVGKAPHISYRYLLERLAAKGFLVVATPYDLSFDHLKTCDAIISRFERVARLLARTYGALPVVGMGHSCGALLQVMITSLFPDTPRAANALISFNNKPVSEAVPLFEELFVPFFTYLAGSRNQTAAFSFSSSDAISVGLEFAKASVQGQLPSDKALNEAVRVWTPPFLAGIWKDQTVSIPLEIRDALSSFLEPPRTALENAGFVPIATEFLQTLEQIPMLINEVAEGARDFVPPPDQVKAVTRRAYRARRTLVMGFTNDPIDETDKIEELLKQALQVIKMKRPMIEIDVQRKDLPGGHAVPLLAPPLDVALQAEMLLGAEVAREQLLYSQAEEAVTELITWLEESNL